MNPYDQQLFSGALALTRSLGAPPRLILHGEIVAEVAGLLGAALSDVAIAPIAAHATFFGARADATLQG